MFELLPKTYEDFASWDWSQIEPYFENLACRPLHAGNIVQWLEDWSQLTRLIRETRERFWVATTLDTTDTDAETRYMNYEEQIMQPFEKQSQRLREYLLQTGIEPKGFEVPLRQMRAEVELFREENLPLQTEEKKLSLDYARIIGAQTVQWEGEEKTIEQMRPIFMDTNPDKREAAWKLTISRQLQDREAINELWTRFMDIRGRLAANAGKPDFRAYRWQALGRFDYTPEDCLRFHDAIEQVVVPAAVRLYEKRRNRLGTSTLRPWDTMVDPENRPALRPFEQLETLVGKTSDIFHRVDSELGGYFDIMRRENLLDLDNRKGKAPGGYCTDFPLARRPFIFMNSVGIHDDIQTLLHEGGHAFHAFEADKLPYFHQSDIYNTPTEFAEVASMSMELLGSKYFAQPGGFYDETEAARAFVEHLEGIIQFWPYMAVVDAFQHWVYTNHKAASDPMNCDAKWAELWDRFMQGIDYTGLEDALVTGWHRKLHIHEVPFYYVEYGLAQLGAVQVWRNSLRDERSAVDAYKRGLSLGNTAPLPQLFEAVDAKFKPDASTLRECVELVEQTIERLDPA